MLRISRHAPPAEIFLSDRLNSLRNELLHWLRQPDGYREQRRAPIDLDVFRDGKLVQAIEDEFQGRCAFCESRVETRDGIHHFRPLADARPEINSSTADYYSWLAYEWLNMLWVCRSCAKAKGRWFPVDGLRGTLLTPIDDLRRKERNLIIDPTREAPRPHFRFLIGGLCAPQTLRGRVTVQAVDLNRQDLVERRKHAIADLLGQLERAAHSPSGIDPDDLLWRAHFPGVRMEVIARIFRDSGLPAVLSGPSRSAGRRVIQVFRLADSRVLEHLVSTMRMLRESDQSAAHMVDVEADYRDPRGSSLVALAAPVEKPRTTDHEIRAIEIRNFRAVHHLRLELPPHRRDHSGAPCLMLLGENAVGKSSILAGIALALVGTRHARKLRLSYGDLARSVGSKVWNQLSDEPVVSRVALHDSREVGEFFMHPDRVRVEGTPQPATLVLGYGPHRYISDGRSVGAAGAVTSIRSLFDPTRPIPHPGPWLNSLTTGQFNVVAKAMRDILPIGDEDDLVNHPQFGLCVFAHGQLTPLDRLSEGYRSVFAMVVDIMRVLLEHSPNLDQAHAVVLIDEIETHLHPRWKMRLMSSLRRAFPRVQFIATTHDPLCLRGMDDGEVVVLERDGDGRVHAIEDLPSIVGMRAEQLLTSEYFGLASTTDPELELALVRLANFDAWETPFDIDSDVSALIARLSIGNTAAAQALHEGIRRFLIERERPRDSLSQSARTDAVQAIIAALRR